MALFTMPRMNLENGTRTTDTDNRSRVPMGFHRLTRSNSHSQGFTLIELLITVAIVGIVAVIATPSLQNFVLNNRIRAQAAALTSSLAFARTEAITRGTRVVTCPGTVSQADLAGGPKSCECVGEKWESGWLVFVHTVDTDGNEICGFDELLEVHGPLDGSGTTLRGIVNVTSSGIVNVTSKVSFIYDGSTQPGTFVLCDQRGWGSDARAIEVLATGRTRNLIATESSQISSCTHE